MGPKKYKINNTKQLLGSTAEGDAVVVLEPITSEEKEDNIVATDDSLEITQLNVFRDISVKNTRSDFKLQDTPNELCTLLTASGNNNLFFPEQPSPDDEGNKEMIPYRFYKSDGTPQKRLYYLAIACCRLLDTIRQPQPKKNLGPSYFETHKILLDFMGGLSETDEDTDEFNSSASGRGWWSKTKNSVHKEDLENLVSFTINTIKLISEKKNKQPTDGDYAKLCTCSLWSIILGKSASDVLQLFAAITELSAIKISNKLNSTNTNLFCSEVVSSGNATGTDADTDKKNAAKNALCNTPNLVFVSSDLICAGLSSTILKNLTIPVAVVCPKKSPGGKTLQSVICQSAFISTISVILSLADNNGPPLNNSSILSFFDPSTDAKYTAGILMYINSELKRLYRITQFSNDNLYDLLLKSNIPPNNSTTDENIKKNRSSLFDCVYNIATFLRDKIVFIGKASKFLLISKKKCNCRVWTYHMAQDICKILFCSNGLDDYLINLSSSQQTNSSTDHQTLCKNTLIAATVDGTYGHDFAGLSCIQALGESFMLLDEDFSKYQLTEGVSKNESTACINALNLNDCITIDQELDYFIFNFSNETNYLFGETRFSTSKELYLGSSAFSSNKSIYAVDYVNTAPKVLASVFSHFRKLVSDSINMVNKNGVSPLLPNEGIDDYLENRSSKLNGLRLVNATSLYDGAADYPTDVLTSSGVFKKIVCSVNIGGILLSITTEVNPDYNPTNIRVKLLESLIPSPVIPLVKSIYEKLQETHGITEDNVVDLFKRKIKEKNVPNSVDYLIYYNNLWGKLLNLKVKKDSHSKVVVNFRKQKEYPQMVKGFKVWCKQNTESVTQSKVINEICITANDTKITDESKIIDIMSRILYQLYLFYDDSSSKDKPSDDLVRKLVNMFQQCVETTLSKGGPPKDKIFSESVGNQPPSVKSDDTAENLEKYMRSTFYSDERAPFSTRTSIDPLAERVSSSTIDAATTPETIKGQNVSTVVGISKGNDYLNLSQSDRKLVNLVTDLLGRSQSTIISSFNNFFSLSSDVYTDDVYVINFTEKNYANIISSLERASQGDESDYDKLYSFLITPLITYEGDIANNKKMSSKFLEKLVSVLKGDNNSENNKYDTNCLNNVVFEKKFAYDIGFLLRVYNLDKNINNLLFEHCKKKSTISGSLNLSDEESVDEEQQDKKKFRTAIDSLTLQLSNVPQSNIEIIANMNVDNTKDIVIDDEKIISDTSENFKQLNSLVDEYLTIKSNMEVDDNDSKEAVEQIKNQIKSNILTDNFETFVATLTKIKNNLESIISDLQRSNLGYLYNEDISKYIIKLQSDLMLVSDLIKFTNELNDNISILLGDPSGGRKLKSKTFKHRKQTTKNKFTPNNKKNQGKNNTRKQKRVFKKSQRTKRSYS